MTIAAPSRATPASNSAIDGAGSPVAGCVGFPGGGGVSSPGVSDRTVGLADGGAPAAITAKSPNSVTTAR
jgi:hypothetical protein